LPPVQGEVLFPVLVSRALAAESQLVRELSGFDDAEGPIVAVVRDLLDAGFEESLEPAFEDCASEVLAGRAGERASAIARVAARTVAAQESSGLGGEAALLARAREALLAAPEVLPARALWLHGFADVTGVQADFIEALCRACGARLLLSHPDDPARPGEPAPGVAYTGRLRERLGAAEDLLAEAPEPPVLALHEAPGAQAEVRDVAVQVRALLDDGVRPEAIGVVARELGDLRLAVSTHFGRLGIPFSGGVGYPRPEARRAHALAELLEAEGEVPVDRFLDAVAGLTPSVRADLRMALHAIGVGRLCDLAELDIDAALGGEDDLRLPSVRGLVARAAEEDAEETPEGASVARPSALARRRVAGEALGSLRANARAWLAGLQAGSEEAALGVHLRRLRGLVARALHWGPRTVGREAVWMSLSRLEAGVPEGFRLDRRELRTLLHAALAGVASSPLGGDGAGVALLGVTEARGRTFEHLFLLACNRDVFPRLANEDPLLPDALRRPLLTLLPDLPVKQRSADEERYLFASLLSAAPHVALSWQAVSDDGKERSPSPLVDRLRLTGELRVEPVDAVLDPARSGPRPAFEHLLLAGSCGGPRAFAGALEAVEPAPLARARVAVLDEMEGRGERHGLPSPYHGFTGSDPQGDGPLYVTRLERLTFCPWLGFLEKELGLAPVPDALAALPDVTPLLLGNVVHAVLERIVEPEAASEGGPEREAGWLARARPRDVPWPAPEAIATMLAEAAAEASRDQGILLPGFARMLARRARPLLDRVRALEWPDGVRRGVLGGEVEGQVHVADARGRRRVLRFRADRVDLDAPDADAKGWLFVDYKTGKPVSEAKKTETRARHLVDQVRQGKRLQVAAYAQAEGASDAVGRYLFTGPELSDEMARIDVPRSDAEIRQAFDHAVEVILAARGVGAFPPRLVEKGAENPFCERCELAEACLRGDSGARQRMRVWTGPESARAGAAADAAGLLGLREKSS
jgi:RecB family exonuclease